MHILAKLENLKLYALLKDLQGVHFLCPHKKRTKESGWGEALTAKPFVTASILFPFSPGFEPPSPQTPSRPPSKACSLSIL